LHQEKSGTLLSWDVGAKNDPSSIILKPLKKRSVPNCFSCGGNVVWQQGDQIGRIFDRWAIVNFEQVLGKYRSRPALTFGPVFSTFKVVCFK
jgi:hypothetical protein